MSGRGMAFFKCNLRRNTKSRHHRDEEALAYQGGYDPCTDCHLLPFGAAR